MKNPAHLSKAEYPPDLYFNYVKQVSNIGEIHTQSKKILEPSGYLVPHDFQQVKLASFEVWDNFINIRI